MMKRAAVILLCLWPALACAQTTAEQTIDQFYREYLGNKHFETEPAFSRGFRALRAENKKLCGRYAPNEVCGFGADGNMYLAAQDYDEFLSYEQAGVKVTELQPGLVQVSLNVLPFADNNTGYYQREITYRLVQENGAWVVDDILYPKDNYSSRTAMADEIALLRREHTEAR